MRRSVLLVAVLTILAASLAALPAAAQASQPAGWVALGAWVEDAPKQQVWLTGELYLTNVWSLGYEYQADEVFLAGRYGDQRGFYGGFGFSDFSPRWEVGVWGSAKLSPTISVAGWLGVTGQTDAPSTKAKFTARAEAYIPVADRFFVLVGVDDYFNEAKHKFAGRIGVGLRF